MFKAVVTRIAHFRRAETGAFTFLAIFFILGSVVALGVSVDYQNALRVRAEMQDAANATALAAAIDLPDEKTAVAEGLAIAALNLDNAVTRGFTKNTDIVVGNFDRTSGSFVAGAAPFNAVQVEMVRSTARNNALPTMLAFLAGRDSYDIAVRAVAIGAGGPCSGGGLFSNTKVNSGSNNDYTNRFCLYGRDGVKISSDNSFTTGVKVEMRRKRDFEQGGSNAGIRDALGENTYTLTAYDRIPGIVASMQSGSLSGLPAFITKGPVYLKEIKDTTKLEPNTLYVVDDVADFGSDRTIKNVAVVAKKEVKVGSNNIIDNVFFASMDKVLLGSNNTFSDSTYCSRGAYSNYLYSGSNIEFGSNNILRGVNMAAMDMIKLGSDVGSAQGVKGVARNEIEYGSADVFSGCPGGLTSLNDTFSSFALVR